MIPHMTSMATTCCILSTCWTSQHTCFLALHINNACMATGKIKCVFSQIFFFRIFFIQNLFWLKDFHLKFVLIKRFFGWKFSLSHFFVKILLDQDIIWAKNLLGLKVVLDQKLWITFFCLKLCFDQNFLGLSIV